jgi:peroxiredoxin
LDRPVENKTAKPPFHFRQQVAGPSICLRWGATLVYAYPRTGRPGIESPDGWDMIPGARGCTPQTCSFRDHFAELKGLGVDHLFGLSTQDPEYQREAAERLHLPFAILSDERLKLTRAMNLPTSRRAG